MAEHKPTYKELEQELSRVKNELAESVKRENYLTDTKTRFRLIYENSIDAILITSPDGKIHSVNPVGCEMFGWSEEEICKVGRKLIINEEDDNLRSALETRKKCGCFKGELSFNRKDGTTFIGEVSNKIFTNTKGKSLTSMIIRDITDRKKTEQIIIEREKRLRELNATKDKFFSIIAHDLRSPFNNILGYSELLIQAKDQCKEENSKKYLNFINSSAKSTLSLLDNILNWARSQTDQLSYNPKKLNLLAVIKEITELKQSLIKAKNISLQYTSLDNIELYSDENMLKLVLRNLISNAIKFTRPEGQITISAISKTNHVEITISDNGIGMSEKTCNNLFDIKTNTTSPGTANEMGSGLGLVLCKEFVVKLGGDIWVKSEEGKGSDFKFTLPLP